MIHSLSIQRRKTVPLLLVTLVVLFALNASSWKNNEDFDYDDHRLLQEDGGQQVEVQQVDASAVDNERQEQQQQQLVAEGQSVSVDVQQQNQDQNVEQQPPPEQEQQMQPNISPQQLENPCNIQIPPKELPVMGASFTASYPGSGAKLTWKLVRAITGIYTGDDHDHNGRVEKKSVVAVKTHYPAAGPSEIFFHERLGHVNSGILLIRNPMNALPSYHNFMYEQANKLLNHSTRAPVEVWIQWRNDHFQEEVDNWVNHAKFWLDRYYTPSDKQFFLLPYEHLTSKVQTQLGIETLKNLGSYLIQLDPIIQENAVKTPETYQCIWELFVLNRNVPGEKERRSSLRSGGPVTYPYTAEQVEYMIQSLIELRDAYAHIGEFYALMQEYLGALVYKKREVEGAEYQ